MQPASTVGTCSSSLLQQVEKGNLSGKKRWWLEGNSPQFLQYFDEEERDNKVMCQLCKQKLTYNHAIGARRNYIQLRHQDR